MEKIYIWASVLVTVGVALAANSISAVWADQPDKYSSIWFLAVILISPLVFITFGLTVHKLGLAVGAGTVDSLLTISTVIVGLVIFKEWNTLSAIQYGGLAFTTLGIILMHIEQS